LDGNVPFGEAATGAGDDDGASAGAAGEGFSGAALPGALADEVGGDYLGEFDVGSLGEEVEGLDLRAVDPDGEGADIVDDDDAVWVSHGDAGGAEGAAGGADFEVERVGSVGANGDGAGVEDGRAHIDRDGGDGAVGCDVEFKMLYSREGFEVDLGRVDEGVVVGVLCYAADAVSAHFGLGAVGVEHSHFEVGGLGGQDEDEAVGADAEVSVADLDGGLSGVVDRLGEAVNVDVIVSRAVHFDETHGVTPVLLNHPVYDSIFGRRRNALVLIIDNYDSFTYNLVQHVGELGGEPVVYRNDKITLEEIEDKSPGRIIISPGPCTPLEAGMSNDVIRRFAGKIPILGVCLGHQCIGYAFGGEVVRAPRVMHGKTSVIHHDGKGVLRGLPNPFEATRYHSLIVRRETLPDCLVETAKTKEGELMGIRHKEYEVEGVQFHPESFLTEVGLQLIRNFLEGEG